MAVTDLNLIKELDELRLKGRPEVIEQGGTQVTDTDLINDLDKIRTGKTVKGRITQATGAISDFFSGTKKTEFADMPEIGEASSGDLKTDFKIAAGLLLNANQKAQAQIIQAQIPGTEIFKDKFDNLIVHLPDGKSFYLNKPGASLQDFTQTTAQILAYIPGYSWAMKKAGKSYLKKMFFSGVAGSLTSISQDIATMPLGSKGIDESRAVLSGIVPIAFEGALSPILSATWKKIMGNPTFTKTIKEIVDGEEVTKVVLNKRGEKAAQAAGIDTTKINSKFVREFTEKLSQGEAPTVAATQAGAGKFNFKLSKAQAAGDEEGMAMLIEAAKGTYGPEAQVTARNFLKEQGIDIQTSASNLIKRFDKGEFNIESIEEAGQNIVQGLQKKYATASKKVTSAYNLVDKDGIFQAEKSNIDTLLASVSTSLKEATAVVDTVLTPATIRSQKIIKDFVKKYKPKKPPKDGKKIKKITPATLTDFIVIKRTLNSLYKTATNNTDRRNVKAIIKEWEKFADDNVDNILFSGDKGGIEALKNANKLARKKFELYDINNIKVNGLTINDKAGKVVLKILNDPDITPTKALDYIFGRSNIGKLDDSLAILRRLKTIFGVEGKELQKAAGLNRDFQSLRTGAWERLVRDSSKNGKFSPKTFSNNWKNLRQKNQDILDELYEPKELQLIDEFVDEVSKTFTPRDLLNASNTASALSRALQAVGRGLGGILGFKLGNIQGLLVFRNLFDRARDIISQKSASKLVNKQLTPSFGRTLNTKTDAALTVGANQLLENYRIRKAPQLPKSFQKKIGDQSALPDINPASFDKTIMAQGTVDQTGLTSSEHAWLDDEEKAMRLKERGYA